MLKKSYLLQKCDALALFDAISLELKHPGRLSATTRGNNKNPLTLLFSAGILSLFALDRSNLLSFPFENSFIASLLHFKRIEGRGNFPSTNAWRLNEWKTTLARCLDFIESKRGRTSWNISVQCSESETYRKRNELLYHNNESKGRI